MNTERQILAICLLCVFLIEADAVFAKVESFQPSVWREFFSETEAFSISFPGTPKVQSKKSNDFANRTATIEENLYSYKNESGEFSVSSSVFMRSVTDAGTISRMLENVRKQTLAQVQGQVLQDRSIYLFNTYQGREIISESLNGHVTRRFYWIGHTLYQLVVVQQNKPLNDQLIAKFFDSFTLPNYPSRNTGKTFLLPDSYACNDAGKSVPIGEALWRRAVRSTPRLSYPSEAREKRVTGRVVVEVEIGMDGKVTTAKCLEGPEELRAAALEAAQKSTFAQILLCGKPVLTRATVSYWFSIEPQGYFSTIWEIDSKQKHSFSQNYRMIY